MVLQWNKVIYAFLVLQYLVHYFYKLFIKQYLPKYLGNGLWEWRASEDTGVVTVICCWRGRIMLEKDESDSSLGSPRNKLFRLTWGTPWKKRERNKIFKTGQDVPVQCFITHYISVLHYCWDNVSHTKHYIHLPCWLNINHYSHFCSTYLFYMLIWEFKKFIC